MSDTLRIAVEVLPDGPKLSFTGRDAWAVLKLQGAGAKGVSSFVTVSPRWSAYIHKIRTKGIIIETRLERHGGHFPGNHARYFLRSELLILELLDQRAAA